MDKKTKEYIGIEDGQMYKYKIDVDSGDVISKIPVKKAKDTSSYFRKGEFFTMHIKMSKMLLSKKDYSNLTFRLLFALTERMEYNNRIRTFRQSELAQELGVHQPHISASLKVLEKDDVIKKKNHDYYFHPQFVRYINDGRFGNAENEEESLREGEASGSI